ncbi:hypothetical protein [Streptomyces sp. NPDC127092]|uniref:hypothetical protein n=1 Tax=Streptomyces sp. NPDC127092 TaxID=3347135 RepID=UPI003654DD3A
MRDNDPSGRADTGLSTEDIARGPVGKEREPGSTTEPGSEAGPETGPETGVGPGTGTEREGGWGRETDSGAPPTYPGESIATSGGEYAGTGADTATDADTVTGARTATDGDETGAARADRAAEETPRLMESADEEDFRTRWHDIQSMFVDDPREAVHAADTLVADVMQKLAATFADHRRTLEGQWKQGEDVDTEDLRTALRQYRSFFRRLLSHGADHGSEEA